MKNHDLIYQRHVLFGCNIIKGAINDWHLCEKLKKKLPNLKGKALRKKITTQIKKLEEAQEFIMSDTLDRFIIIFCLPLNADRMRKRALKIVQGKEPKKIKITKINGKRRRGQPKKTKRL